MNVKTTKMASSIFEADESRGEKITTKEFGMGLSKGKLIPSELIATTVSRFVDKEFALQAHARHSITDKEVFAYINTTPELSVFIQEILNADKTFKINWTKDEDTEEYTGAFEVEVVETFGKWVETKKNLKNGEFLIYTFRETKEVKK